MRFYPYHGHCLQTVDKTVEALYFAFAFIYESPEGDEMTAELLILADSLVAGVGKVEDVAFILRIEHEGILVAAVHRQHQLLEDALSRCLHHLLFVAVVIVIGGELVTQYSETAGKAVLLQHSHRWHRKKQHQ